MTKSKKNQKPKNPPLKPHYEENIYGKGVVVMRIPKDTPQAEKQEALRKQHELARKFNSPDPYW